jgi:two-component sensor histidine kinase
VAVAAGSWTRCGEIFDEAQGSSINDLVRDQLAPYATDANASIGGPDIMLTAATTQALAMVLHELVTNAAKYRALSIPGGHVSVTWEKPSTWDSTTKLTIMWRETGCTSVAAPTQFGFGTSLIRDLIPHELGGSVDLASEPRAFAGELRFLLNARKRGQR